MLCVITGRFLLEKKIKALIQYYISFHGVINDCVLKSTLNICGGDFHILVCVDFS